MLKRNPGAASGNRVFDVLQSARRVEYEAYAGAGLANNNRELSFIEDVRPGGGRMLSAPLSLPIEQ